MVADDQKLLEQDDDSTIINEAVERFKYALSWENDARKNWLEDFKFANGDSYNLYQWPHDIRAGREVDSKPNLTINKVRQHNLNIINDARQNKPSLKTRPVSDEASYDAAQVIDGIFRHIEYQSKAQVAYDTATSFQVQAGIGYLRVETAYADDETFDQEIFIRRVRDPLTILMDPDAAEADYSDGRFAFVFEDIPRDKFNLLYPDEAGAIAAGYAMSTLGGPEDFINADHVRRCEYWRRMEVPDELLWLRDEETGRSFYVRKSAISATSKPLLRVALDDPNTKRRSILRSVVQHFFLVGDMILKRERWAGIYIPVVPVIGEETVIEKKLDRKGHTRAMLDPQRMYNYYSSEGTAQIALQTKTPYVAPAEAIEGYETYWADANNTNLSVLPYNWYSDNAKGPIPPPQRQQGPVASTGILQGMQIASEEVMSVSGQYQSQLGQPSNERSGKAIAERQRQGDNATYHYIDNLAVAIRQIGRICLDLIPKVYDQKRTLRILGEDGSERQVTLDPGGKASYEKRQLKDKEAVEEVFNPGIGKYDVQADIGPSYSTARQEAWNAFVQIAAASPQIMGIVGDLMFKAADFPMAEEIAERFYRTIPPSITGDAPPQAFQQQMEQAQQSIQMLMQQNEQLRAQLEGAAMKLTQKDLQLTAHDQKSIIDAYRAETDRIKVMMPDVDPQQLADLAARMVLDAMKTPLGEATDAAVADLRADTGSFGSPGTNAGQQLLDQARSEGGSGQNGLAGTAALSRLAGATPGTPINGPPEGGLTTSNGSGLPPGARLAADGQHYVPDPRRPGKHLLVVGGAQ